MSAFIAVMILCLSIYPQKFKANPPSPAAFNACWFYPTSIKGGVNIASDNIGALYLPLTDGKLLSINSITAEKTWETSLIGDIISVPLIDQENVYIVTKNSGKLKSENDIEPGFAVLHSLGKNTGITRWLLKFSSSEEVHLYNSENFIVLIIANGDVYSISKADGQINWKKTLGSAISSPPLKKTNEIILSTFDKRITALSLNSGEPVARFITPEPPTIVIEDTTGNNFVVGDKKGNLWSLNKKKKTPNWSFRLGGEISNVKLTTRGLLASSLDNFVYLISEKSGKLIWKKRLTGRIAAEPQIQDNNFIITSIDESEALVIQLSSGRLVTKIFLEDEDFFTGESLQSKNLFIYTTRKGIFSFSLREEGCKMPEKM